LPFPCPFIQARSCDGAVRFAAARRSAHGAIGGYQGNQTRTACQKAQERTNSQIWTAIGAAVTAVRIVVTAVKNVMTQVSRIIERVCRSVAC
jgi:hypothetical protein